jgi:hypothetical protein
MMDRSDLGLHLDLLTKARLQRQEPRYFSFSKDFVTSRDMNYLHLDLASSSPLTTSPPSSPRKGQQAYHGCTPLA